VSEDSFLPVPCTHHSLTATSRLHRQQNHHLLVLPSVPSGVPPCLSCPGGPLGRLWHTGLCPLKLPAKAKPPV
jgi:hypothetical protein